MNRTLNRDWQERMRRGQSDHWNRRFGTDIDRNYGRNHVRALGGYVESDDHLPIQRQSIYEEFRADPELGFRHVGISTVDPSRLPGNFTGKGPRGYKRADRLIEEEVCETLTKHPDVDASGIEVTVNSGIITLDGRVASRRQKALAEDSIESILGIEDIENRLRVETATRIR